jgi:hypothetical protein
MAVSFIGGGPAENPQIKFKSASMKKDAKIILIVIV